MCIIIYHVVNSVFNTVFFLHLLALAPSSHHPSLPSLLLLFPPLLSLSPHLLSPPALQAKVNKVHWVLRECLSCVPDSFDVTRSLLMYGVSKTEFSQLVGAQGEREGLLSLEEEQEENGDEDNPEKIRRRILSWGSLSEEQKFLCQCRLRLLVMLDRLSCYEVSVCVCECVCVCVCVCMCVRCASLFLQRILGGPRYVDDRYQSEEFRWFREENAVRLAANYARVRRHTRMSPYSQRRY